jgi:hypothetical protein
MKINVHIERLILEGLPVSGHEGPHVRAAVEAELSRLLGHHGISEEFRSGGAFPTLRASPMRLEAPTSPRQIGRQIAQSVYGGFGRQR